LLTAFEINQALPRKRDFLVLALRAGVGTLVVPPEQQDDPVA